MEKALILSHVVAGGTTLLSGIVAAFFGRKGGKAHRLAGNIFFWSMFWIFISAMLIITFVRFNAFLMVIAVFSWYMAFSGQRVLKLRKTMQVEKIDWIAAIITLVSGLSFIGMGLNAQLQNDWGSVVGYLCFFFGFFTAQTAWLNIKGFKALHKADKMWWWFAHMNLMGGAFIASITAFLVQNGSLFSALGNAGWILWVLPAAIGSPLIAFWANRYRRQFGIGKYAKVQKA